MEAGDSEIQPVHWLDVEKPTWKYQEILYFYILYTTLVQFFSIIASDVS